MTHKYKGGHAYFEENSNDQKGDVFAYGRRKSNEKLKDAEWVEKLRNTKLPIRERVITSLSDNAPKKERGIYQMIDHSVDIHPVPLRLIQKFEPKSIWLSHESNVHGVDHMTRVFIFQEFICDKLEAQGVAVNREALRWASITHDVGRIDDGLDMDHGRRSAKWIKDNLSDQMSPEVLDTVTYIVHWHVPSDNEAPVMTTELKVLKDADALDRVRLGDLDLRYLRTDTAKTLARVSTDLYQSYINEDTDNTFDSVVKVAQGMGLIERLNR